MEGWRTKGGMYMYKMPRNLGLLCIVRTSSNPVCHHKTAFGKARKACHDDISSFAQPLKDIAVKTISTAQNEFKRGKHNE